MQEQELLNFAPLMIFLVIFGVMLAVNLAIQVFCCWFLSDTLKKIPPSYRSQEPGMVWLLLIPSYFPHEPRSYFGVSRRAIAVFNPLEPCLTRTKFSALPGAAALRAASRSAGQGRALSPFVLHADTNQRG